MEIDNAADDRVQWKRIIVLERIARIVLRRKLASNNEEEKKTIVAAKHFFFPPTLATRRRKKNPRPTTTIVRRYSYYYVMILCFIRRVVFCTHARYTILVRLITSCAPVTLVKMIIQPTRFGSAFRRDKSTEFIILLLPIILYYTRRLVRTPTMTNSKNGLKINFA